MADVEGLELGVESDPPLLASLSMFESYGLWIASAAAGPVVLEVAHYLSSDDVCALNGWYGGGFCDSCPLPDPDCGP